LETFTDHFLARLALEIEMLSWSIQCISEFALTIDKPAPARKRNFRSLFDKPGQLVVAGPLRGLGQQRARVRRRIKL
jgi:hypothetical protein